MDETPENTWDPGGWGVFHFAFVFRTNPCPIYIYIYTRLLFRRNRTHLPTTF
ncbi:hypothetical protein BDV26DRAFT_260966 [Aspergillus bertholletiae]|uniref:Uncharacterized protein n=1 Tax=Aspergillus bertholletiae TaxID=1226010 RepID=A0A5N7BAN0_9EURO|nr:hypothetical protein BDV26DRAFT_260966 [Aspergillus bertholletiae]